MTKLVVWLVSLTVVCGAFAQTWQSGPTTGFRYTRFDGEYFPGTGKVYFLGGRLSAGTTDGSVWSFDPAAQTYADAGVDMPKVVSNYDICYLRDDYDLAAGDTYGLYIVGGRYDATPNYYDSVQVYYPTSNRTRRLLTDPFPGRAGGAIPVGMSCVAVGNKMYVMGGFSSTSYVVLNQTWVFDPLAAAGSRWTQLRNTNFARAYSLGAVVDSFVFAIGGDTFDGTNLYARATCERFNTNDTAAGWTRVPNCPKVLGQSRAFGFDGESPYGLGGKIITAGRGVWPEESTHCFIYNTANDSWAIFPNLLQARRNHAGALIPGTQGNNGVPGIWVWGGRQVSDTTVLRSAEYYQLTLTGTAENPDARVQSRVFVTPNPSRGQVTVRLAPGLAGMAALRVYDVLGKAVHSSQSDRGFFIVRGLAAGTYLVRLEAKGCKEELKFVVTR